MKKIILNTICFLIVSLTVKAQAVQEYNCPYLQHYAGEWRYTNGQDTIRVFLRTHRWYSAQGKIVQDDLIGWHEYKRGNTIIESNYQNRFGVLPFDMDGDTLDLYRFSIDLSIPDGCGNSSLNNLHGSILDYAQNGLHSVAVTSNPQHTELHWSQWTRGKLSAVEVLLMTLPSSFTLIKQ